MSYEKGKKIVSSLYVDTYSVKIISIPVLLLHRINEFVDNIKHIVNEHFYYKSNPTPFLLYGAELYIGYNKNIYTIEDLKEVILYGTNLKCDVNGIEFRLTKQNINDNLKYISVGITNKVLLNMILSYIKSEYMLSHHPESDIVNTDKFGISNNIPLVETTFNNYESFSDLLTYTIGLRDVNSKLVIDEIYYELFTYIVSNVTNNSTSKDFSIKGYNILITESTPPSGVRFLMNSYLSDCEEKVCCDTANDIALKEKIEERWVYD